MNENNNNNNNNNNTSSGMQSNIAATLSYLFGFITGIIFLVIEKDDEFVRFHAMQSIVVSAIITVITVVIGWIPIIGWLIALLIGPISFILWIVLMYKAYNNEWFELPIAGKIARDQVKK